LTNQLLGAQGKLVAAQNDLFNQWLSYMQSRIGLYRDMGLMPLDGKGIWIDDVSYYHSASAEQGCLPHFLPSVAPAPYYGDDERLPRAVPPPVPAQPDHEQLPPPVRLLRPTFTAPHTSP